MSDAFASDGEEDEDVDWEDICGVDEEDDRERPFEDSRISTESGVGSDGAKAIEKGMHCESSKEASEDQGCKRKKKCLEHDNESAIATRP